MRLYIDIPDQGNDLANRRAEVTTARAFVLVMGACFIVAGLLGRRGSIGLYHTPGGISDSTVWFWRDC